MLSDLFVANFKSIGNEGINIRPKPLTILTGPNGAGKSSILEAICLLSQSISSPAPRIDGGEYVRYSSPQSFLHNGDLSRLFQISLTVDVGEGREGIQLPGFFYGFRYSPLEVIQRILLRGNLVVSLSSGRSGSPSYTVKDGPVQANP